jgi:hypothetical protein
MLRVRCSLLLAVALLSCLAPLANSQATAPPFTVRVQYGPNVTNVADGGTATIPADAIGMATAITVTATYTGLASADVTAVDLTGHTDFSITSPPSLPATLRPRDGVALSARFMPTTSNRVLGQMTFGYIEGRTSGRLTINLAGVTPEFAFSYIPQGGNATLVAPGGTVSFPATAVNATSSAVVVLTNRGTSSGVVSAISLAGGAFQLQGAPLPNTTVEAGKDLRFTLTFTPKQLETSQGTLSVQLADRPATFNLSGSGSGPLFAYETVLEATATTIVPNQVIALPDALIGEKSSLLVRVRNTGTADGSITAISMLGTGFQLADLPFLPLTLAPGGAIAFTIQFTPTQPGRISGRLRVGNDTFDVMGAGLGPTLAYFYAIGDTNTSIQNNGSVIFTPAAVGRTATVRFYITNNGTAPGTVTSLSVTGASTAFTLSELPRLPISLSPGATAAFTIQFTPTVVGAATATLKVDTLTFTLSASATAPDPLPSYRFDAPSGSQEPMQQPAIGLTLAAPYPLNLNGTLTLAFNSEVFSNDPAVQFALGSRTVNFTIPANTTKAVFPQGATQVKIQTGTVAGTINITPSFATDAGINLTPANPSALNLVVPQSAPRLLSIELSAKTSNTLTLLLRGYATSRSVTQMDFQFTPTSSENVSTTKLSLSVEPSFLAWFQSTSSQQYGSQFTATVTFTLQGDVKTVTSLADTIQSVSATLTNRQGVSAAASVTLR